MKIKGLENKYKIYVKEGCIDSRKTRLCDLTSGILLDTNIEYHNYKDCKSLFDGMKFIDANNSIFYHTQIDGTFIREYYLVCESYAYGQYVGNEIVAISSFY